MVSSWTGAQEVSGSSPSSLETPPLTHTHTHSFTLTAHALGAHLRSLHPRSPRFSASGFTRSLAHAPTRSHTYMHKSTQNQILQTPPPPDVSTHPCCTPCSSALNRTWVYCQSLRQAEPGTSSVPAVTEADVLGQCHLKPSPCLASLLLSVPPLPLSSLPASPFLQLSPRPSCTGALKEFA